MRYVEAPSVADGDVQRNGLRRSSRHVRLTAEGRGTRDEEGRMEIREYDGIAR